MDDHVDDENLHEVEITFDPRPGVLEGLGITIDDFETALVSALEAREDAAERLGTTEEEMPPFEEMMLEIHGVAHKLDDLAEVEIGIPGDDPDGMDDESL